MHCGPGRAAREIRQRGRFFEDKICVAIFRPGDDHAAFGQAHAERGCGSRFHHRHNTPKAAYDGEVAAERIAGVHLADAAAHRVLTTGAGAAAAVDGEPIHTEFLRRKRGYAENGKHHGAKCCCRFHRASPFICAANFSSNCRISVMFCLSVWISAFLARNCSSSFWFRAWMAARATPPSSMFEMCFSSGPTLKAA